MNAQANPPPSPPSSWQKREPAPRPPLPGADELREHRHILAITAVSGLTLGVVLSVAFELLSWWMRSNFGGGAPRAECTDETSCPEGKVCLSGQCIIIAAEGPVACGPGEPCGAECECNAPMTCVEQVCTPPASPPAVCDDPDIQRLLAELSKKCAGDFFGCPETELQKFVIESETFDDVLAKFPDTITVHFDEGKPPLNRRSWPPPAVEEHYLERLGAPRNRKALDEASLILLIARSSAGKGKPAALANNVKFARNRSSEVKRLLGLLGESPAARSALTSKIRAVNLGSKRPLPAALFNERYRNSRITWSHNTDMALGKGLTSYERLRSGQKKWVDNTINQVVFVVPITCALPAPEASP